MNTKLAVEFTIAEKLNLLMVHIDITLCDFKGQLDQINSLNHKDTRTVDSVEYRRLSIDSDECVHFT